MSAIYTEYDLQLVNARTGMAIDDDSGTFIVMTVNTPTPATIYSDDKGTLIDVTGILAESAQTMANGVIRFYTAAATTSVDITLLTANGEALFLKGVTPDQHKISIDVDKLDQRLVIPWTDVDGSEIPTGFTILSPHLVTKCDLIVTTVDSGDTINVGLDGTTSGAAAGFINGASIASEGYVELTPAHTAGTNADYYGASTVGSYLATAHTGADTDVTTLGGFVAKQKLILATETDANITFTTASSEFTGRGYIIVTYMKLPASA